MPQTSIPAWLEARTHQPGERFAFEVPQRCRGERAYVNVSVPRLGHVGRIEWCPDLGFHATYLGTGDHSYTLMFNALRVLAALTHIGPTSAMQVT